MELKDDPLNYEIIPPKQCKNKIGVIYGLTDPRYFDLIRYVGKSEQTLKDRFKNHIHEIRSNKNSKKLKWMRELSSIGLKPIPVLLEYGVSTEKLGKEESYFISITREECAALGIECVNGSTGGEGDKHSEKTKEKIRQSIYKRVREKYHREPKPLQKLPTPPIKPFVPHVRINLLKIFVCKCGREFNTERGLISHLGINQANAKHKSIWPISKSTTAQYPHIKYQRKFVRLYSFIATDKSYDLNYVKHHMTPEIEYLMKTIIDLWCREYHKISNDERLKLLSYFGD